jgi:hypothetical protein
MYYCDLRNIKIIEEWDFSRVFERDKMEFRSGFIAIAEHESIGCTV